MEYSEKRRLNISEGVKLRFKDPDFKARMLQVHRKQVDERMKKRLQTLAQNTENIHPPGGTTP